MGLVGRVVLMIALIAVPFAAGAPISVLAGGGGGWSSFRLAPVGDEIAFRLTTDAAGAGSFGVDLYDPDGTLVVAMRVGADPSLASADVGHKGVGATVASPDVILGGAETVISLSSMPFGCGRRFLGASLVSQSYEIELANCTALSRPLVGIAYGAGASLSSFEWTIDSAPGTTFELIEREDRAFVYTLADFEGTGLIASAPAATLTLAQNERLALTTGGFTGGYVLRYSLADEPADHTYVSASGAQTCPCTIAEIGVAGERVFELDETRVSSTKPLFILAGVDARLPP